MSEHAKLAMYDDLQEILADRMSDFIVSENTQIDMAIAQVKIGPSDSEMHIRMAKAAMDEFRRSVVAVTPATRN